MREPSTTRFRFKFEAGTPDIAGVIGLGAAIAFINNVSIHAICAHEHELLTYGTENLSAIPGLRIVGTAREKAGVISFVMEGIHPHDVGTILDQEGIAVRTGHHCAQPMMERYGIPATVRASLCRRYSQRTASKAAAGNPCTGRAVAWR